MKYLMMLLVLGSIAAVSVGCKASGSVDHEEHSAGASGSMK